MNIAIIKKTAIALAAVTFVATGSISATTSQAHAGGKNFGKALAAGIGTAIVLGAIHRNTEIEIGVDYDDDDCWTERQVSYDDDDIRHVHFVRICD